MSTIFTNMYQFNKYYFPKSHQKKHLERMSIKELSKYQISLIMRRIRRILKEVIGGHYDFDRGKARRVK